VNGFGKPIPTVNGEPISLTPEAQRKRDDNASMGADTRPAAHKSWVASGSEMSAMTSFGRPRVRSCYFGRRNNAVARPPSQRSKLPNEIVRFGR